MKSGKAIPIVLSLSLLTGLLWAADFWDEKPYTEWSEKEVERLFNNSPWGKTHTVTIANASASMDFRTAGAGNLDREQQNMFHIRFLSAKPMRMAVARRILLNTGGKVDMEKLNQFVERGDPDNFMLVMELSARPASSRSLPEYRAALMRLRTPDLTANTSLATNTGKKVYLAHYEPPGPDGLGAKFFFPRTLPDGTPVLTPEDKEIRFETEITMRSIEFSRSEEVNVPSNTSRTDRIYRQFKLKDMIFRGKLEI